MAMIDAKKLRERVLEMSRTAYSIGNRGRALAYDRVLELIDDLEEDVTQPSASPAQPWPPASFADRVQVASLVSASLPWDPVRDD
jgi:hypothetical protein